MEQRLEETRETERRLEETRETERHLEETEKVEQPLEKPNYIKRLLRWTKRKLRTCKKRILGRAGSKEEERRKNAEEPKVPVPAKLSEEGREAHAEVSALVPERNSHEQANMAVPVEKREIQDTVAKLQLRITDRSVPLIKTFPAEATLFEVASTLSKEHGI